MEGSQVGAGAPAIHGFAQPIEAGDGILQRRLGREGLFEIGKREAHAPSARAP